MPIMKKTLANKEPLQTMSNNTTESNSENDKIPRKQSSPKINIAIETDDGDFQPAEIDDVEETNYSNSASTPDSEDGLGRRHSITDRIQKIKLGEDAAKSLKIEAEQRKKILENLLEEHENLVRSIVVAEPKENTV